MARFTERAIARVLIATFTTTTSDIVATASITRRAETVEVGNGVEPDPIKSLTADKFISTAASSGPVS